MKPEITKLEEFLGEDVSSQLRGMTETELKEELVKAGMLKEGYKTIKKEDKDLIAAKETVKEISTPHNEAIKAAGNKHRFISMLLEERKK